MKETCENCKYFDSRDCHLREKEVSNTGTAPLEGFCFHAPPTVVTALETGFFSKRVTYCTGRPITFGDRWCSKFAKNPKEDR